MKRHYHGDIFGIQCTHFLQNRQKSGHTPFSKSAGRANVYRKNFEVGRAAKKQSPNLGKEVWPNPKHFEVV